MTLQAGAAIRDISPGKPMALCGYPHVERISEGIHDPLLASVIYINNGSRAGLLVALDLVHLDPPTSRRWRHELASALDLPESAVFISCTHTHSGPVMVARHLAWRGDSTAVDPAPEYLSFVESRIRSAAIAAKASKVPVDLAWTVGNAQGVGTNRHDPRGATDPECGILVIRRQTADREMLGMAMVYGMHPTVLHEDSKLVSSDFPHYTRQSLRQRYGEQLVVCYHNAPCGNQSPRHVVNGQTFSEAERLGEMLAGRVIEAVDELSPNAYSELVELDSAFQAVEICPRSLPELAEAEKTLSEYRQHYQRLRSQSAPRAEVRTAECAVFGAEKLVNLAQAQASGEIDRLFKSYQPIEVQALRIGDHCLVGLPGELFTEYALQIKSRADRTFPVAFVNGELQGYIVTPEAVAAGGYEAAGRVLEPESGSRMVEAAVQAVRKVI